jgi:hypothetical protein
MRGRSTYIIRLKRIYNYQVWFIRSAILREKVSFAVASSASPDKCRPSRERQYSGWIHTCSILRTLGTTGRRTLVRPGGKGCFERLEAGKPSLATCIHELTIYMQTEVCMYVGAVIIPTYEAESVLQTYANLSRRPRHTSVIVGYGVTFGVEGASHVVLCATPARRGLFC